MVSEAVISQNRAINELRRKIPEMYEQSFSLVNNIVNENGFVGAVVSGDRQLGKSMYMLKALSQLYLEDWDKVFAHMFFDMDSLLAYLVKALETDERVPCIALDDAGVHFGAQQYNMNRNMVGHITALLDTIGIITKSILLTVPNRTNLIKSIREGNFYSIEIHQDSGKYGRKAIGYRMHTSPKGQEWITTEFTDLYDVRIPDEQYERYFKLRKQYSAVTVAKLAQAQAQAQKEPQKAKYKQGSKYSEIEISDDDMDVHAPYE
jgi:hypothetical protein